MRIQPISFVLASTFLLPAPLSLAGQDGKPPPFEHYLEMLNEKPVSLAGWIGRGRGIDDDGYTFIHRARNGEDIIIPAILDAGYEARKAVDKCPKIGFFFFEDRLCRAEAIGILLPKGSDLEVSIISIKVIPPVKGEN